MKTSVIITLCLAILQLSIAQNEETTLPSEPLPPAEPATEPSASTEAPTTPQTLPTASTPEPVTETSTIGASVEATSSAPKNKSSVKIVDKLSDQIRSILKHFHESEPTGFPGQTILPDPMQAPNATANLGIATGEFFNLQVHGLSNFTVEAVNMFLDEMQVYVRLRMKKIVVSGNVTASTMFTTSKGPFNMTLTNVTAEGNVYLKVDSSGKLYASNTTSDMHYQTLEVGSSATSLFQAAMNGAGVIVLLQIKPSMLDEIEKRLTLIVNEKLEESPKIPKIVGRSPVDLAIIEGRNYVRELYEPFTIKNIFNHDSEYLILNIGPVTIHGLSKFARVGNITMQMTEGVIQLKVRFITGRLGGNCKFYYDFGKVGIIRNSTAKFVIDHLQFEAKLNQSINLRKKPILDDLQLEAGRALVKLDDTGDFDFLVELVVELLPDMLRHLIIDSLEEPVKEKIQSEILDKVNFEQLVEENLPLMETLFVY